MSEITDKKGLLKDLPDKPGIYKFFDITNELIYVGKAKNIKKRVSNYFNKITLLDNKTKRLVSHIANIEYTIVNSEFDAYLLENNLIKTNQPRYNILLKDDKTYPYLYISNERFPRVISTRTFDKSLGTYFGPFTSVKAMNTVLELLTKLYSVRTCNFNLSEKNVTDQKFSVCLEYHIGNCKGPCEGRQIEDEYVSNIKLAHHILKGNIYFVKNYFKEEMEKAAVGMEYEKAQILKNKLTLLEKFQSSSVIVSPRITNVDVFTIISNESFAVVNFLNVVDGMILKTKTLEIKKKLNESDEDLLQIAIINIRQDTETDSREIISNVSITIPIENVQTFVPLIGDKKKLVDLSLKNATYLLVRNMESKADPKDDRILKTLQADLQLKEFPDHIECFDNSNIQGASPVAAMVCFRNGRPAKRDYRHYNIKTVEGPNDFDSMFEIVFRRYKRCLEEKLSLPKLIIVDGGKGQLSAACRALNALEIYGSVPIIGIAKRLEEIYYPEDQDPLYIDKRSESLKLIQNIRNEAHRFAITHHRNKRSKKTLADTSLLRLKGLGEKTMQKLIIEFKTITNIKNATIQDLAKIIGEKRAEKLKNDLVEPK